MIQTFVFVRTEQIAEVARSRGKKEKKSGDHDICRLVERTSAG